MIALVLGIVAGLLFYDFCCLGGTIWNRFFEFDQNVDRTGSSFFSIASGIAAIGDVNKLKRVGLKVLLVYVVMTVGACLIGIAVVHVF